VDWQQLIQRHIGDVKIRAPEGTPTEGATLEDRYRPFALQSRVRAPRRRPTPARAWGIKVFVHTHTPLADWLPRPRMGKHIRSYWDTRPNLTPSVAVCLLALFGVCPAMGCPPLGNDSLAEHLDEAIDVGTRAPLGDCH
jgi:hypothetical protein